MNENNRLRYIILPGTESLPSPPHALFESLYERRGGNYHPHTKHLNVDGSPRYTNRLFLESSPYLLQHAHNPVNWFPWGEEAFELARGLNRPLLVSIGYATCHWCHVMEEESFEDEEIARYMNENFIAIKVDREERPDIDSVLMTVLHAMKGQGGWPLNIWLTPDKKPFYGGTYFPPRRNGNVIGFLDLLALLKKAFQEDQSQVARAGTELVAVVQNMLAPSPGDGLLLESTLELAIKIYRQRFDPVNGGAEGAPKFPSSLPVRLLLRMYERFKNLDLLQMAKLTLNSMAAGGIRDQIGGGFHRYATDNRWLIPHFEKMLYDNALLALVYLEGFQLTGEPEFARVTHEILHYLQRELGAPDGGFYSASDADSLTPDGRLQEGYFFTWTLPEIQECLGKERSEMVAAWLGVTVSGNMDGRSVMHRTRDIATLAREFDLSEAAALSILEESKQLLLRTRALRPPPQRDEKILASWNGLAISAFARAALTFDDARYLAEAQRTAEFVLGHMRKESTLAHSYQEGEWKGEAFLDDYSFMIAGLLDLFESSGEPDWLQRAIELTAVVEDEFEDHDKGGFFFTGVRHEQLIAREKPAYDGATPSGNSVMVMNLLRLHQLTERQGYLDHTQKTLKAFSGTLSANPTALSEMLLAVDFLTNPPEEITIVAPAGKKEAAQPLLDQFRKLFIPNRTFVMVSEGEQLEGASRLVPFLAGKKADGESAVAYVCHQKTCLRPTSDAEEFSRSIRRKEL